MSTKYLITFRHQGYQQWEAEIDYNIGALFPDRTGHEFEIKGFEKQAKEWHINTKSTGKNPFQAVAGLVVALDNAIPEAEFEEMTSVLLDVLSELRSR